MSAISRMKSVICIILISLMITLGVGTSSADARTMLSCTDVMSDVQNVSRVVLETFSLFNSEEVSVTGTKAPVMLETLRLTQVRSSLSIQWMQFLLVYIPAILMCFFMRYASVFLCMAQGRGVIINFIHNKDGRKELSHFLYA